MTYADAVFAFGGPFVDILLYEDGEQIENRVIYSHAGDITAEDEHTGFVWGIERDGKLLVVMWVVVDNGDMPESVNTPDELERFTTENFVLAEVIPAGQWKRKETT